MCATASTLGHEKKAKALRPAGARGRLEVATRVRLGRGRLGRGRRRRRSRFLPGGVFGARLPGVAVRPRYLCGLHGRRGARLPDICCIFVGACDTRRMLVPDTCFFLWVLVILVHTL